MNHYRYFEHDADVGVIGRGALVEDAFCDAARALFALTTDIGNVKPSDRVEIDFDEPDVELALVAWLNLLLGHAHERRLALGEFRLHREADHWRGEAWGEPWREGLTRGTDVKGATLTSLAVEATDGGWEARCVVDV